MRLSMCTNPCSHVQRGMKPSPEHRGDVFFITTFFDGCWQHGSTYLGLWSAIVSICEHYQSHNQGQRDKSQFENVNLIINMIPELLYDIMLETKPHHQKSPNNEPLANGEPGCSKLWRHRGCRAVHHPLRSAWSATHSEQSQQWAMEFSRGSRKEIGKLYMAIVTGVLSPGILAEINFYVWDSPVSGSEPACLNSIHPTN